MSFAPPPVPPPPPVPDGWKAQYDDRYKQWFFVNLQTGKSQWEQPETPAQKQDELHEPPSGPPPSYEDSGPADPSAVPSEKKALGSNNPYNQSGTSEDTVESDARLAARLQAEENARTSTQSPAAAQPGAATDYYNETSQPQPQGLSPAQSPVPQSTSRGTRDRSRSFLSKLMGKKPGGSSSSNAGYGYSRPPPPAPVQQPAYGYPPVGYQGGYTQPGYGYPQYPMGGGGGYYPSRPQRQGGMGNMGAAALGAGGGLLGGAMLASAFSDHDHGDTYIENNYDGDGGDYGGGDYGGGGGDDFGGGDFGGDF